MAVPGLIAAHHTRQTSMSQGQHSARHRYDVKLHIASRERDVGFLAWGETYPSAKIGTCDRLSERLDLFIGVAAKHTMDGIVDAYQQIKRSEIGRDGDLKLRTGEFGARIRSDEQVRIRESLAR